MGNEEGFAEVGEESMQKSSMWKGGRKQKKAEKGFREQVGAERRSTATGAAQGGGKGHGRQTRGPAAEQQGAWCPPRSKLDVVGGVGKVSWQPKQVLLAALLIQHQRAEEHLIIQIGE